MSYETVDPFQASPFDQELWNIHERALRAAASPPLHILFQPLDRTPALILDQRYEELRKAGCANPAAELETAISDNLTARPIEPPPALVSLRGRSHVMATLIDITYPDLMREFADPQRIAVCLERDRAHDFSFLVLQGDENGQARYTAGCLAFMETSKVNPERPDPVLYLDDMAVLPEARTALGGVRAFRELLVRTGEIDSFELRARVGGSYNAFRKGETRDTAMSGVLRAAGWTAVDHGPARTFGSGAEQIVLNLITVKRTGDPKAT